jgi:DNA-binding protein H-NS
VTKPSRWYDQREGNMPAPNLKSMDVNALMALRGKVEDELGERRADLEMQISRLDKAVAGGKVVARMGRRKTRAKSGPLVGRKIAPKYRDKKGNTWAGRGVQPRWLVAAIKSGKKLEEFLIQKSRTRKARSAAKKRKAK